MKKILTNKKIVLVPISMKYLDDIHEYSSNPIFFKYFEYNFFKTKNETRKYLKKIIVISKKNINQYWAIILRKNKKCIGTICAKNLNKRRKSVEVGYGINADFWNKGYFSLSLKIFIKYLFEKIKIKRIYAKTSIKNKASIKGLKKNGFRIEGKMKSFYKVGYKYVDAILLAKINF